MKRFILIIIALVALTVVQSFSSGDVYESLQMDEDCTPTGYTVVYELEWISQDTLQVTISERSSSQGDKVTFYNLTGNTGTGQTSSLTISNCSANTKLIPFDEAGSYVVSGFTANCWCLPCVTGQIDTGCSYEMEPPGMQCVADLDECPSGCELWCTGYSGNNNALYSGNNGSLLVVAEYVIFIID